MAQVLINKYHAARRISGHGSRTGFNHSRTISSHELQAGKLDGDLIQTTPDLVCDCSRRRADAARQRAQGQQHHDAEPRPQVHRRQERRAARSRRRDGSFGLFYNKAIFDAAKITNLPTTTDEWFATAKQLTARPNHFGMTSAHLVRSRPASGSPFKSGPLRSPAAGRRARLHCSRPIRSSARSSSSSSSTTHLPARHG